MVRPTTANARPQHQGAPVSHNYMRDDLTQNLPAGLQRVDRVGTAVAKSSTMKYQVFKEWLLANGAVFDDVIEYPAVFEGGLEGLAAKEPIGPHRGYIFIPNTLIISVERAKACPELRQLIADNYDLFGDIHPDREQLLLATFLLYHHLQGEASFWHPYLGVMNVSDLVCDWAPEEVAQFMDKELQMDAELYKSEVETEWEQI